MLAQDPLRVLAVGVARGNPKLREADAVLSMRAAAAGCWSAWMWRGEGLDLLVVESQEAYLGSGSRKSTPKDLIWLATVAGLMAAIPSERLLMPRPKEWKGQVPKAIQQGRKARRLGWQGTIHETKSGGWFEPTDFGAYPPEIHDVRGTQWGHVMDAIGLALWGLQRA